MTTIYHDATIFVTDNPLARQLGERDTASTQNPAVVVVAKIQQFDSSDLMNGMPDPAWEVVFIGSITEFHQGFVMGISQAFDHGKARSPRGKRSGSDFVRYLNRKTDAAQELTGRALRFLGIDAVTWGEADAKTLGIDQAPIIAKAAYYTDTRYGFEILGTEDARKMVLYTLTLRRIAQNTGVRITSRVGLPIKEHPTRLKSSLSY